MTASSMLGFDPTITRTDAEFDTAVRKWEKAVEDVIIDIAAATDLDGLALQTNPMPVIDSFNALMDELRAARSGSVRYGMKRHAD